MTNTTTPTDLIGYSAAAARWGVSTRTIARLVAAGDLTRHPHPSDKRGVLVDPVELTKALGPATQHTETITVGEAVTVLLLAISLDQPGVYQLLRSQLSDEMLDAVVLMVGGPEKLSELDAQAGYSEGDEG